MIFAVIVAGGKGLRFGGEMPKQFAELGGKAILIRTLSEFVQCELIEKIAVVCPTEWIKYTEELIKSEFYSQFGSRIFVIPGGTDRNSSVLKGCEFMEQSFGTGDDLVLTHDGVRPFVTGRMIRDSIKALENFDAVNTVIPVTDTIAEVHDGVETGSPERRFLFACQTPQSFRLQKLLKLCGELSLEERAGMTDTCGLFIAKGEPVAVISGSEANIKITTPFDMITGEMILKMQACREKK